MKIILTSKLHQTQEMETFIDDNGSDFIIWHQDTLDNELFNYIINIHGRPDALISSAHPTHLHDNITHYYWPDDLNQWAHQVKMHATTYTLPTEYCFNFMINKNQINRYLLIKLIEWYNLTSFDYTWRGTSGFNCQEILSELQTLTTISSEFKQHLLQSNFNIAEKFIILPDNVAQNNINVWNHGLGEIFSKSAISLITESVGTDKVINYTEKTLFAMQGLTFPIWIGGYAQAEHWKNHGFDIFSDIINHNYQYCDTLVERCNRAISDNLQLLTDLSQVSRLREVHVDRLLANRDCIESNMQTIFLDSWNCMPKILQQSLINMIKGWPERVRFRNFRPLKF